VPNEIGAAGWWIFDPGDPECRSNDVGDGRRSQGPEWRVYAKKHAIDGDLRPRVLQIVQNSISSILWQRQTYIPTSLASHQ
jgi:hypothetical protein